MFNRRDFILQGSGTVAASWLAIGLGMQAQAAEGTEVLEITSDLVARAKKEGKVSLRYASPVEEITPIVTAFQKQFDVGVELDRKAGSTGNQQFATEERAGQHIMDVSWLTDPLGLRKASAEGLYLNWTIPDVEKRLPRETYVPGWGYCPYWSDHLIPYNPDIIPHARARELFKTWNGLLDPSLSGLIGLVDPGTTNSAYIDYMMLFELPQYGKAFFQKLAAQKPRIYAGSANGREDIAAGAVATFIPAWESAAFLQFLGGSKVAWVYPEIAPSTAENHVAISKNAPHPMAARLFAAWILGPDGARAIQLSQSRPTLIGAPEERSAVAKLKQTEWWTPKRADTSWVPTYEAWSAAYPTLLPEMRRILNIRS